MPRDLDSSLSTALSAGTIVPAVLVDLTLRSGVAHIWSGAGDLVWNGNTYKGVGALGGISPITEGSDVRADGVTLKLDGLSQSGIASVSLNITPPALPVAIPDGQSVMWAYPRAVQSTGSVGFGSTAIFRGCTGEAAGTAASSGTNAAGALDYTITGSLGGNIISVLWSDFQPDRLLPLDAVIHSIYPVLIANGVVDGANSLYQQGAGIVFENENGGTHFNSPLDPDNNTFAATQFTGPSAGSSLSGLAVQASLSATENQDSVSDSIGVTAVAFAIYYSSASGIFPTVPMLQEISADIQLGAPAKVYFGLMSGGAFIGSPYLAFSGQVDQPTIEAGSDTISISLALENRLSNLSRPSGRRYTAADQRLFYPDDSAFDWVETLNDRADRWGG